MRRASRRPKRPASSRSSRASWKRACGTAGATAAGRHVERRGEQRVALVARAAVRAQVDLPAPQHPQFADRGPQVAQPTRQPGQPALRAWPLPQQSARPGSTGTARSGRAGSARSPTGDAGAAGACAGAACQCQPRTPKARAASVPLPSSTKPSSWPRFSSASSVRLTVPSPPISTTRLPAGKAFKAASETSMAADSSGLACGACCRSQVVSAGIRRVARPPAARGSSRTRADGTGCAGSCGAIGWPAVKLPARLPRPEGPSERCSRAGRAGRAGELRGESASDRGTRGCCSA